MKMKKEEKAIQNVELMCKDCKEAFQTVAEIPLEIVLAMIEDVEDE